MFRCVPRLCEPCLGTHLRHAAGSHGQNGRATRKQDYANRSLTPLSPCSVGYIDRRGLKKEKKLKPLTRRRLRVVDLSPAAGERWDWHPSPTPTKPGREKHIDQEKHPPHAPGARYGGAFHTTHKEPRPEGSSPRTINRNRWKMIRCRSCGTATPGSADGCDEKTGETPAPPEEEHREKRALAPARASLSLHKPLRWRESQRERGPSGSEGFVFSDAPPSMGQSENKLTRLRWRATLPNRAGGSAVGGSSAR